MWAPSPLPSLARPVKYFGKGIQWTQIVQFSSEGFSSCKHAVSLPFSYLVFTCKIFLPPETGKHLLSIYSAGCICCMPSVPQGAEVHKKESGKRRGPLGSTGLLLSNVKVTLRNSVGDDGHPSTDEETEVPRASVTLVLTGRADLAEVRALPSTPGFLLVHGWPVVVSGGSACLQSLGCTSFFSARGAQKLLETIRSLSHCLGIKTATWASSLLDQVSQRAGRGWM